jgi:hypothetical protein
MVAISRVFAASASNVASDRSRWSITAAGTGDAGVDAVVMDRGVLVRGASVAALGVEGADTVPPPSPLLAGAAPAVAPSVKLQA